MFMDCIANMKSHETLGVGPNSVEKCRFCGCYHLGGFWREAATDDERAFVNDAFIFSRICPNCSGLA